MQATLYRTAQLAIFQNPGIQSIKYALPNKHYVPVDMSYRSVENVAEYVLSRHICLFVLMLLHRGQAEVFIPLAAPSGLITATVSRKA